MLRVTLRILDTSQALTQEMGCASSSVAARIASSAQQQQQEHAQPRAQGMSFAAAPDTAALSASQLRARQGRFRAAQLHC
jgi:hypothetical protein